MEHGGNTIWVPPECRIANKISIDERETITCLAQSTFCLFLSFSYLFLPFSSMAKTVPFHLKEYWEDRFEKEEHFEWLADWPILKPLVEPYLHQDEPILHIGV